MRLKSALLYACLSIINVNISIANEAHLFGNYESSNSDIIVMDSTNLERAVFYNLGILNGNDVSFTFRYANLNAWNTAFGDSVTNSAFSVFYGESELGRITDIFSGDFTEDSVSVDCTLDSLSVFVKADSGSDPIVLYRPCIMVTDSIAPGTITDLQISGAYMSSLLFSWTAPGDNNHIGQASFYEMRYSAISPDIDTSAWWDSATIVANLPDPGIPGDSESYYISRLDTSTTYYIMMVTYDEMGNRSAFSNMVSGTTVTGRLNYCLYFNGNVAARIPYNAALNPTLAMTIEAWFYLDDDYDWNHAAILDKPASTHEAPFYQYNFGPANHTDFYAQMAIDSDYHPLENYNVVTTDTWTHAAITFDGISQKLYLDGNLIDSFQTEGLIDTFNTGIRIGALGNFDSWFFKGYIDEIRLWNVARTQNEILQSMNHNLRGDEEGLAAYWRFDEGFGQEIHDYTASGADGFLGNQPEEDSRDPDWVLSTAPIDTLISGVDSNTPAPREILILQNYPNPFNNETVISFNLPGDSRARVEIFDILGRHIRTVCDDEFKAGEHKITWDGKSDSGTDLASGFYYYRLKTDTFDQTRKMLKVK